MTQSIEKVAYEAPEMEELGSFETLTQSTNTGITIDANFNGVNILDGVS